MALVSVYETHSATQAHLIKGMLTDHGVDAWVTGDLLQGGVGELQAIGFVQVRVESSQAQQAKTLIDDFEQDKMEIDEQTLTEAALGTTAEPESNRTAKDREREFRESFNNKLLLNLGWIVLVLLIGFLLWSNR